MRAGAAVALVVLASACGVPGRHLFVPARPLARADAIVVLGNRPPVDAEGRIAPELARRVRHGVTLFERGLAPRLVVTGGPAPGGIVEADVMARYAQALGVPPEAIVRERRARDTADNARLSVDAICGGRAACHPRVIVVSSPYHLRRALRLFRCAGADPQPAASALPDDFGTQLGFATYEYGVAIAYIFVDACARARRGGPAR